MVLHNSVVFYNGVAIDNCMVLIIVWYSLMACYYIIVGAKTIIQ